MAARYPSPERTPPTSWKQQHYPSPYNETDTQGERKFETRSVISGSSSSRHSQSSSVLRAEASAAAAAASKNAAFEDVIARREAELKTNKATKEMERIKEEATAEADRKILRARQKAAVEKARSDAIIECELDYQPPARTSPNDTTNDHVRNFTLFRPEPTSTPQTPLRADASPFTPDYPRQQPRLSPSNPFYSDVSPIANQREPVAQSLQSPQNTSRTEERLIDLTKHITNTLARQRQPIHEPDVFNGDPLLFLQWRASFNTMVEQTHTPVSQKLTYLTKYTNGEARMLVDRYRHCHTANPERGYREVWLELERRFGDQTKVTAEIIKRIQNFPSIRESDRRELQGLADLCSDATVQMRDLPGLGILNYPHTLYPILEKLPERLHNNWRKEDSQKKMASGKYPNFSSFASFLSKTARMYNDPEIYPVEDRRGSTSKAGSNPIRVMATSNTMVTDDNLCLFHQQKGHHTSACIVLSRKPLAERKELCRKFGLCFRCAKHHLARECREDVKCTTCQSQTHAQFMHTDTDQNQMQTPDGRDEGPEEANINCTKFSTCETGRSCSRIVLTKIYQEDNPRNWMHGYVVLDDQSNACLGDPKLFQSLGHDGPEHEYELSTCGGHGITTKGRIGHGIILEAPDGHKERLPTVIENPYIPGDKKEIPTPDLCHAYQHLEGIANLIPDLRDDVDIVLLLGRICPEPLKVRESRNGPRNTPWAQRSDLGWTISSQMCISSPRGAASVSVCRTMVNSTAGQIGECQHEWPSP